MFASSVALRTRAIVRKTSSRRERVGVQHHVECARPAADELDLTDPANALKRLEHLLSRDLGDLAEVSAPRDDERQHGDGGRVEPGDDRRIRAFG
jgi:hypothetical protein